MYVYTYSHRRQSTGVHRVRTPPERRGKGGREGVGGREKEKGKGGKEGNTP